MSFIASGERVIPAPPSACFEHLADFDAWSRWMPEEFRPVRGPSGRPLALGDRFVVRIAGAPGTPTLRITRAEPGRSLAWGGGVPGVLLADHVFYFDDAGDGATRVRSVETWSGALALVGPVARRVRAQAERVGAAQLAGLARSFER